MTIYALCEPESEEIRYIGQTRDVERRLRQHVTTRYTGTTQCAMWIRALMERGEYPKLTTLSVVDVEVANEAEIRAIQEAKQRGENLTNAVELAFGGGRPPRDMEINSGQLSSDVVRRNWRDVMDYVIAGNHVVVSRAGKPVVAFIPIEDFKSLVGELEDFYLGRSVEKKIKAAVVAGEEWAIDLMAKEAEEAEYQAELAAKQGPEALVAT